MIFSEPLYAFEISRRLYGRENKRVFLEIRKLEEDRWIKAHKMTVQDAIDGRSQQRIYYQANINPILNHIEDITQDTVSDPTNEFSIKYTLESLAFRYFIKRNLPEHYTEAPINAIDFILTYFDFLAFISSQNNYIKKFTRNIHEEEDYKNAIKLLQKDKRFIARSLDICELLYREKNTPVDVIEQLPYLFIFPGKLIDFYSGFSSFGAKYFNLLSTSRDISKLFEKPIRKK
jgi:hypothetical protein